VQRGVCGPIWGTCPVGPYDVSESHASIVSLSQHNTACAHTGVQMGTLTTPRHAHALKSDGEILWQKVCGCERKEITPPLAHFPPPSHPNHAGGRVQCESLSLRVTIIALRPHGARVTVHVVVRVRIALKRIGNTIFTWRGGCKGCARTHAVLPLPDVAHVDPGRRPFFRV
jgi:hypothetical protein